MDTIKYIKSFSKGQITIPKDLRDQLHLGDDFWLKLIVKDGKVIIEPLHSVIDKSEYKKKILKIKGDWFNKKEWKKIRSDVEKRIKKNST